jgi:hypothetical protein
MGEKMLLPPQTGMNMTGELKKTGKKSILIYFKGIQTFAYQATEFK